jgi:hypothetical protein
VEENYLQEQIFNMDETSSFWERMPARIIILKEAKSMPGFKLCVRTLYDVRITTKSPNDTFSERFLVAKRRMTLFFKQCKFKGNEASFPLYSFLCIRHLSDDG